MAFFTDCRPEGIRVSAIFKSPSSGVLFAKNKLRSCKEEFRQVDNAVLTVPLQESEKDCGQRSSVSIGLGAWPLVGGRRGLG